MWKTKRTWKKTAALFLVAGVTAITWTHSGYTQSACVVERGQDPLDILNTGVRHNVWIILDTSGSMREDFQGTTKLNAAKRVLRQVMAELVDAAGDPLVNWGFVHFAENDRNLATACTDQFRNSCVGLATACDNCSPPGCFGEDNRSYILADLDSTNPLRWTPNGISLDGLSNDIVANGYVSNLNPDQKNFFIIVTDGDDTCECDNDVWTNPPADEPDPVPPQLRSENFPNSDPTRLVTTLEDIQAYNAGLKGRLAYQRLNPADVDRKVGAKGSVFVVGMGLGGDSRARANHLAWEGSGAAHGNPNAFSALFADNEEELLKRLRDALARIGVWDTEVNLGTSVVASVKELIPEIPGVPVTADEVIGDVSDLQNTREARFLRAKLQNNVVFATSVETNGFRGHFTATNVYQVTDFDTPDEARRTDDRPQEFKEFWDAGELLRQRHPNDRTILFHRRGDTAGALPTEFVLGGDYTDDELGSILGVDAHYMRDLDPTGEGARTRADAARIVVQVIRGYRLIIDDTFGFYDPNDPLRLNFDEADWYTWKLLDPTNVGPTVVLSPPRSPDADPPMHHYDEYGYTFPDGFYWDHLNRQTVACIGTNGGLMHCFRADNGAELFAYIPADILGDRIGDEIPGSRTTLKDIVPLIVGENNGIENHRFFIASSASVEDVYLDSDNQWHTALAFGRGRGGKFVTALDISNLPDWDGTAGDGITGDQLDPADTDRLPRLMFNVGNHQGINDGPYDGFGETWSVPVMGNVVASSPLEDRWVMFVGAGYGCTDQGNEGQYLYVLDMEDGSVIRQFLIDNDPAAAIPYNGLVATPTLYNPHFDDPDLLDQRDYTTRVYIGDLQGRVYKLDCYHQDPLAWTFEVFYDEIGLDQPITAAAALKRPRGTQDVIVLLGTGGDRRVDDATTQFKFLALSDIQSDGANSPPDDPQGQLVWELELEPTWRVMTPPVVGGDMAFFAATRIERDLSECNLRFFSQLQARFISSGLGVFDLDTDTGAIDNPLDLGEGKATGLFFRDNHLYVSMSGAIDIQGETMILGRDEWDIPPPPGQGALVQLFVRGFRLSPF